MKFEKGRLYIEKCLRLEAKIGVFFRGLFKKIIFEPNGMKIGGI